MVTHHEMDSLQIDLSTRLKARKRLRFRSRGETPKEFKGKSRFTLEQIESFRKEGKCFECAQEKNIRLSSALKGLNALQEQKKLIPVSKPSTEGVPDILGHTGDP